MICLHLKDICLDLIAKEFETFHFAFTLSNNETLKRNFEFLQRKYSSVLLSKLFKRKELKNEYLSFLLNEHLEFLAEEWIYANPSYLCSKEYVFSRLPNLTAMYCEDTSDIILKHIAKFCPKIVDIDGITSSVTNRGVYYLCKKKNGSVPCPALKELFINTDTVTKKGVMKLIRNLKYLEKLNHKSVPLALYSMHKKHLTELEKIPRYNLNELKLYDGFEDCNLLPYYNDLLKICLTVCPNLKSLACAISDEEQLSFFKNTSLRDLSITFTDKKIDIDHFLKKCGFKLNSFKVVSGILSISKLSVSCPNLQYLTTVDVTFLDDHDDSKTVFNSLFYFTFFQRGNKKVNEKSFGLLLLSSPSLENVTFFFCDLSPNMKTYILKCCEKHLLKSISFMKCTNVDKNFAKNILLSCPSLKTLDIFLESSWNFSFTVQNELVQCAETLPNKPRINFSRFAVI